MGTNDQELIELMKDTILYQTTVIHKRSMLVQAITHNVKYLASIHSNHQITLKETKLKLDLVES